MLDINCYYSLQWSAMPHVKSLISYKFNGFNLNIKDQNNINGVQNRLRLEQHINNKVFWLNQLHSNIVSDLDREIIKLNADSSFTRMKNKVCVALTADCVPILLTDKLGSFVSAIHAGWRGLQLEIIKNTLNRINLHSENILCYIGPSICKEHYEVSNDVLSLFNKMNKNYNSFFLETSINVFLCDLKSIAKYQMLNLGVQLQNIFISKECTVCENNKYFSYRLENNNGSYGVFASCIWME